MSADRVKFQSRVSSQLPTYVREDFPLLVEFLEQYYISQEYDGATLDLIQNLDRYVKVDALFELETSTVLASDLNFTTKTIVTDSSGNFTYGFPDRDGLIMIDDEIIYYEYKTEDKFENCSRGFSAVTSYDEGPVRDKLVFTETSAKSHKTGATIKNLSILFLQQFFKKLKTQIAPGFDDRTLYSELDQRNFLYGVESFYQTKGTEQSFEILFRALYGLDVEVIDPSKFLLRPSNANYKITQDFVVEAISGDPMDLRNFTLNQEISGARGSVSNVVPIDSQEYPGKYFQISVDSGFQRDISVQGTIFGEFQVEPKTIVLGQTSADSEFIDVDSTIGFPSQGNLFVVDIDGSPLQLTYTGKTINQFTGVSGLNNTIGDRAEIRIDSDCFAFTGPNFTKKVTVRICSALKRYKGNDDTLFMRKGEKLEIQSIGLQSETIRNQNWFTSAKVFWNIKEVDVVDLTERIYRFFTYDPQFFKNGFNVTVENVKGSVSATGVVVRVFGSNSFAVKVSQPINTTENWIVTNIPLKGESTNYPQINDYFTNVLNTYTQFEGDVLVAANSIPTYPNTPLNPDDRIVKFGSPDVDNTIITIEDHGFYTGDGVFYSPGTITLTSTTPDGFIEETQVESKFKGVDTGVYYIYKINENQFSLSKSRADIYAGVFVQLTADVLVEENTLTYYPFVGKGLEAQPVIKQFTDPVTPERTEDTLTLPGKIGMFVNGVEIENYKGRDKVFTGEITQITPLAGGSGYDVVTPPILNIQDTDGVGIGATGTISVRGSVEEIQIIDTGFDYIETPTVKLTGGNGSGSVLKAQLKKIVHRVNFNSNDNQVVDAAVNTIGFTTFHKFRDYEKVVYETNDGVAIVGLTTGAAYYVGVEDAFTVKLYNNQDDAVSGINTVGLGNTLGIGLHTLKAAEKKSILSKIVVADGGSDYTNNKRDIPDFDAVRGVGISSALNIVTIPNHQYINKDIVQYTPGTSPVDGLESNKDYYVSKINDESFRLVEVGIGTTARDDFWNKNIYVEIDSGGNGSFNHKPIVVTVEGVTGVSTLTGQDFNAVVQPIVRGEIFSVNRVLGGVGYGASTVYNLERQPELIIEQGQEAEVNVIVNDGTIVEVNVTRFGQKYGAPPRLKLYDEGEGQAAQLTPIISNTGILEKVIVINGGVGFSKETKIKVENPGINANLYANIQHWDVNLFNKTFDSVGPDDGILSQNLSGESLQYVSIVAPRKLRQLLNPIESSDSNIGSKKIFSKSDLEVFSGVELTNTDHSPIIGWAYDGNPIYGPYGFSNRDGSGLIRQMKSGYTLLRNPENRPPYSVFPSGHFSNDYLFEDAGDLDIHNGRFCVTPDFPGGVYAYFSTYNETVDTDGPYAGFRRPAFPYLIGSTFNSLPNSENFKSSTTQSEYDFKGEWFRNTLNYHIEDDQSGYKYVINSAKERPQVAQVESISIGQVSRIGIFTGGDDYKVGDKVVFDYSKTSGSNASASVSFVEGKEMNGISVATSEYNDVQIVPFLSANEFIGLTTTPHTIKTNDFVVISGLSTEYRGLGGAYTVGIVTNSLILRTGVATTDEGVSFFEVSGAFDKILPNNFYKIDDESVKVLNIDKIGNRIRVLRAQNGTTGAAHSLGTTLQEQSREFRFSAGVGTSKNIKLDTELYFNPAESVGLGTTSGTGVGNTITFADPGAGRTQVFIKPKQIYFKNHELNLNDEISYETNGGTSIQVWNGVSGSPYQNLTDFSELYVYKFDNNFIGISSNKIGIGSTGDVVGVNTTTSLLSFTNVGTGDTHSFTTNFVNNLRVKVDSNVVTVSTAVTHSLQPFDRINIDVKPKTIIDVDVIYNEYNRRIVFDPRTFSSGDVDVNEDSINFSSKFFETGDRVIYTETSSIGGLVDQEMYYVLVYERNKIRLTHELYQLNTGEYIDITSAGSGKLSRINPNVILNRNNTVRFNLSDESLAFNFAGENYSAFAMEIYKDSNYQKEFVKTEGSEVFNVTKTGQIGITADAKLEIDCVDDIPESLFYRFLPVNTQISPTGKLSIVIDNTVTGNNQVQIVNNAYSTSAAISGVGSTSFTYSISTKPTEPGYNEETAEFSYITNSRTDSGPISSFFVENGGTNFNSLPGITSVRSLNGRGALVTPESNNIGIIQNTNFSDIGYDYPSDETMRLVSNVPERLTLSASALLDFVGISSQGRNYTRPAKLVFVDGETKKVLSDVETEYKLGDTRVKVITQPDFMSRATPRIVPTENSNGVGILSASFDSSTRRARAFLDTTFSVTPTNYPIEVGDSIIVEGVSIGSIGVGTTGKGYNSADHGYTFFEVTNIDFQLGGANAFIEYDLSKVIKAGDVAGNCLVDQTYGNISNERDLATFSVQLRNAQFAIGEEVVSETTGLTGQVREWTDISETLTVLSKDDFKVGEIIRGVVSRAVGTVEQATDDQAEIITGAGTTVIHGWQSISGYLNNNFQKLPNNEYYQNFSYSLKSQVPYDTWNDPVSAMTHTAGFQKFGDLQIESKDPSFTAVVQPAASSADLIIDLESFGDLNCYYSWDDVSETTVDINGTTTSTIINFDNKVLTDYIKSISNRALRIDDFSNTFNSVQRLEQFSIVATYPTDFVYNKIITLVTDQEFQNDSQMAILSTLNGKVLSEYAVSSTNQDLGTFDVNINLDTNNQEISFFPTFFTINKYDITTLSFSQTVGVAETGSTSLGNIVRFNSNTVTATGGSSVEVITIPSTYRSAKIHFVAVDQNTNESFGTELNLINDGSDVSSVFINTVEESNVFSSPSTPGIGTIGIGNTSGSTVVTFHPSGVNDVKIVANIAQLRAASGGTGGSTTLKVAKLSGSQTSIASTASPSAVGIASFTTPYECDYLTVQLTDTTNTEYELFDLTVLAATNEVPINDIRFGDIRTGGTIGTVGTRRDGDFIVIEFTPVPNVAVDVKVYENQLQIDSGNGSPNDVDLNCSIIGGQSGNYTGTQLDPKTEFELKHNDSPIFRKEFLGNDPEIVSLLYNTIDIPNHYFETGELLEYAYSGAGTTQAIGIATVNVPGIGNTDFVPHQVYAVKVDDKRIRLATSAEKALKYPTPEVLDFTTVGIGVSHSFTSTNQNSKILVAIDNMIQSPISRTGITTTLESTVSFTSELPVTGIQSFFAGDIIKVQEELMTVTAVNSVTNNISVLRAQLGTVLATHPATTVVRKMIGNYNIVNNNINFVDAPFGKIPVNTTGGDPELRDFTGLTTSSTFQGRVFLRTAPINSSDETYDHNYVFDDISSSFNGITTNFTLKSSGNSVSGMSSDNAVIMVDGIIQKPDPISVGGTDYEKSSYTMFENGSNTDIQFFGTSDILDYDPNRAGLPLGGVIVSLAMVQGLGYQPLVSAGGTAVVSGLGTISSISIGNSGSGYRPGIQTFINVGVQTYSDGAPNIEFIGTAAVSGGHIVSIAITNPGVGYTSSNPPVVVIDAPLNYTNIPLIYSNETTTGVGTGAVADIIVGQGSSVINFNLRTSGYGYKDLEKLTVEIGGTTGIPTDTSFTFNEFQLEVESIKDQSFNGWSVGGLKVYDSITKFFDGERTSFPLLLEGEYSAIDKDKGVGIDLDHTLIVFIGNVLQEPGVSYNFNGGSFITFTKAPEEGEDSLILFFEGTPGLDTKFTRVPKTVQRGDTLEIPKYRDENVSTAGQDPRIVSLVPSTDFVNTTPYTGPGIDPTGRLLRPVDWCKSTVDKIVDGTVAGKDRELYETSLFPTATVIQSVGLGSTEVYVDHIRPMFNAVNEKNATPLEPDYQNSIRFNTQFEVVGAAGTALLAFDGTITDVIINNIGAGYTQAPTVTFETPSGIGTQGRAEATAIVSNGSVDSITVTNPGVGYTRVPNVLIEPPKVVSEKVDVENYYGDNGDIVGMALTTFSSNQSYFLLDFYIPVGSPLRDEKIVGTSATSISGISTGDFFVLSQTNGALVQSRMQPRMRDNVTIIGTTGPYLDGVWQVDFTEHLETNVTGVGTTAVVRVFSRVALGGTITFDADTSDFSSGVIKFDNDDGVTLSGTIFKNPDLGEWSWGKIDLGPRFTPQVYTYFGDNGAAGLGTCPLITRQNRLAFEDYQDYSG